MQEIQNQKVRSGSLKISNEVVASIAEYTVREIEGVVGLAPVLKGVSGLIAQRSEVNPVSIIFQDGVAVINLRLIIDGTVKLPVLSKAVQSAVKESVQNMTGIVVSKVNLQITGITFAGK